MVVNRQLLFELESVLLRDKFRRYLAFGDAVGYVLWLHEKAESGGAESGEILPYTNDPDDDYLVALALAAGVDFLVSGDRHLLDLGELDAGKGTGPLQTLSPREFSDELKRWHGGLRSE